MEPWEHRSIVIHRESGVWSVVFGDGDALEGIDRILDEYGSKGWELVAFTPQSWSTASGQYGPYDVTAYRAVFKRRTGAAAAGAPGRAGTGGAGGAGGAGTEAAR